MNKRRLLLASIVAALATSMAQAQAFDGTAPATALTGGLTSSQTIWLGFAGLSAAGFIFAMVIKYGRKGTK